MKLSAHYLILVCVWLMTGILISPRLLMAQKEEESMAIRPVTISTSGGPIAKLSYFHKPANQHTEQPLSNGSIMQVGDVYRITFTPAKNCYVYIFEHDVSGKIVQLFPGNPAEDVSSQNSNPVQKDTAYYVPSRRNLWRTVNQPMLRHLSLLASSEPDTTIEEQYQFMLSEQKAQNDFGTLLAQDELNRTIEIKSLSKVTPIIQPGWMKKRPFNSPMIAAQIIQVLRIPFSMRGGDFEEKTMTPEMLKGLPTATLLNLFKGRSAEILPESKPVLAEYGKALQTDLREVVIVIAAHTDNQGSPEENLQLAQRRAEAVQNFFYKHFQIPADRLRLYFYGGSQPLVSNETSEGRRLNNRIELIRIK